MRPFAVWRLPEPSRPIGGDEVVGARRRYYSITALGREQYQRAKEEWENAKVLIDKMLIG